MSDPIDRLTFDAAPLMRDHLPVWHHPNKRALFEISSPEGSTHSGQLEYTRWAAIPIPADAPLAGALDLPEIKEDVYDYAPTTTRKGAVEWHVNFADPSLFVAYSSRLFAQDEIQVAEHPSLGALREALLAGGHPAVTVEDGQPTPVLVSGVECRCRVALDANPAEDRPHGLYGNRFATASIDEVRRATTRIDPPTISNIIAMAAPGFGSGAYTRDQVEYILTTAFTGFRAAALESSRIGGAGCPVIIHTGFWGCGAFGGNRVLMCALQIVAARLAGLSQFVFHTVNASGTKPLRAGAQVLKEELRGSSSLDARRFVSGIVDRGFEWGVSDGN